MNKWKSFSPRGEYLLLEKVESSKQTEGGVLLPEQMEESVIREGRIVALGSGVAEPQNGDNFALTKGAVVLFDTRLAEALNLGVDLMIVPLVAIVAVSVADGGQEDPQSISSFFELPEWAEFETDDYNDWKDYLNLRLFSFKVNFLEPFRELDSLGNRLHECLVEVMRGVDGIDLRYVEFQRTNERVITILNHDRWQGAFIVDKENNFVEFQTTGTSVPDLHMTLPRFLTAFRNTLASPEFKLIAGEKFDRASRVVIRFRQRLRLEGRGSKLADVQNSELMEQFLQFGRSGERATLDALRFTSQDIGRIDLKISFAKELKKHTFLIFANIQAPANEDHSVIDLEWELQDQELSELTSRCYSPVLTDFFRDLVLRSFFKDWLQTKDDIACVSVKD